MTIIFNDSRVRILILECLYPAATATRSLKPAHCPSAANLAHQLCTASKTADRAKLGPDSGGERGLRVPRLWVLNINTVAYKRSNWPVKGYPNAQLDQGLGGSPFAGGGDEASRTLRFRSMCKSQSQQSNLPFFTYGDDWVGDGLRPRRKLMWLKDPCCMKRSGRKPLT